MDNRGIKFGGGQQVKGYNKNSLPESPSVSIVTAVFNGEKHLEKAILSVFNPQIFYCFDRSSPASLAQIMADCWQKLFPGPDLEQEAIARESNNKEIQLFAQKFLEIARQAAEK